MPKKMGRPIAGDEPKDRTLSFRVTETTFRKFDECAEITKRKKVDLLEDMVDALHEFVTKEQEQ